MDRNQYDDHALWPLLDNLKELLAGDLTGEVEHGRSEILLAHAVVQYVDSLRGVDPGLVDLTNLDALNQDLTNGRDYLNQYLEDREANASVLTSNATTSFTAARATALHSMPPPPADDQVRAALDATDRYKDAANAEIAALRERIEDLKALIGEANDQRSTDAETAQTALVGLQDKITESEQTVATQTTQLQEQIDTQRTTFTEESEQREAAFRESEAARAVAADEQQQKQAEHAKALLSELTTFRNQARNLIEATGRDAVSGDYQVWANKQGNVAKWWNIAAVAVGLITVGALVWVVLGAQNDSTQFLISKSSVGLIGLIVAGYAGRQAAEHRAEERTAKRLGLDLAALEPFLEKVDDPQALRVEIAKRVFAPERDVPEERRLAFGHRGMSLTELAEFIKVIRTPPQ